MYYNIQGSALGHYSFSVIAKLHVPTSNDMYEYIFLYRLWKPFK